MDQHHHIDDIIKAIRQRIRDGMGPADIAKDLSRFLDQDIIFLCYAAAKIMEDDLSEWYGRD
jgi:hypothetical protein